MRTLILGIGNTLLSDEGIGVHVVNHLQSLQILPESVQFMDGGTLSFTLANEIEQAEQLVVIDASELGKEPGAIQVFENEAMDTFVTTGNKKSVHEVGLADVMSICMLNQGLPAQRALIGIQPQSLTWGEHATPAVARAIPIACSLITQLLSTWQEQRATCV